MKVKKTYAKMSSEDAQIVQYRILLSRIALALCVHPDYSEDSEFGDLYESCQELLRNFPDPCNQIEKHQP